MIGPGYWATGITIEQYESDSRWYVRLEFFDDGWCEDGSTQGTLRCRYPNADLAAAIDSLKADAERLGITWGSRNGAVTPTIYYPGDGGWADTYYPPNWREIADEQAKRLGWKASYSEVEET